MIVSTLRIAIDLLFRFLEGAILLDVILSWIPSGIGSSGFVELLHIITDPLMKPGRIIQEKLMPGLMIDFSPIVALVLLDIIRGIVFSIL
ncbi:YggT family protein [Clostridium sp. cel8]|uniref:YggT family protein n=1 Tax=unclassified Clostridium TaxID=2614128 RepID=UPI0015F5CAC9|nr:YggT family protein [Clostridium sp. cel8]MBA5850648.1 YggT family protein [Clostridium sp. cel8]